jgi:hypothetical protein
VRVRGVELFDDDNVGAVLGDDAGDPVVNVRDTLCEELRGLGAHDAALDEPQLTVGRLNDAVAGDVEPRIDAEDARGVALPETRACLARSGDYSTREMGV